MFPDPDHRPGLDQEEPTVGERERRPTEACGRAAGRECRSERGQEEPGTGSVQAEGTQHRAQREERCPQQRKQPTFE